MAGCFQQHVLQTGLSRELHSPARKHFAGFKPFFTLILHVLLVCTHKREQDLRFFSPVCLANPQYLSNLDMGKPFSTLSKKLETLVSKLQLK